MGLILRDKREEQTFVVVSHYKGLNRPFRYSTGIKVPTMAWDGILEQVDLSKLERGERNKYTYINGVLNKYKAFLEQTVLEAQIQGETLTVSMLREKFDEEFKEGISIKRDVDLLQMFQNHIDDCKSGKVLTKRGVKYSKGRIEKYVVVIKQLEEFFSYKKVFPDEIDMRFFQKYCEYRYEQGIALNTLASDIRTIKALMKITHKDGLHNNDIFNNEDFHIPEEHVEKEFLSDEELDLMYNFEFEESRLDRVRDVFIIGCYTGLRFTDLANLNRNNIVDGNVLKVVTQKTGAVVYIPLHWRVLEILDKYGGKPPKAYTQKYMNPYIREVCQMIGLTDKAYYKRTQGGVMRKEVKEKWQRISMHTARRTFATNLFLAGFDSLSIMKITGHKSETAFMGYICVTQRQVADRMKGHPYFMKPKDG